MSSGGGSQTTVQKSDPWKDIQPQLKDAATKAQNLYNAGGFKQNYFPGSTVVGYSPETQAALGMTAARAISGSPVTNAAQGLLTGTINGDYLNSNPYADTMVNRALDDVQGRVNSSFAGGGRFGGGLNQQVLAQSLGDTSGQIRGQLYDQERNRQMQSMLFAPEMANQDYADFQRLADVGKARESLEEAKLNENIQRFYNQQSQPADELTNYTDLLQRIGGTYGSQTATGPKASSGGGLLGTAGGILGAGSSAMGIMSGINSIWPTLLASDIRLKENIEPAGTENGFNIYEFSYKGRPGRYRGVMAQEVMKTRPDAVQEIDGNYWVNYSAIGVGPKQIA